MKSLYAKLFLFQEHVEAIKKESSNPFFKMKYADINTLIETIKPALVKAGLIVIQPLGITDDSRPVLLTIIADPETGEQMTSTFPLIENTDPQKMGAIITYMRRYALQSILLLNTEDDDANVASGVKTVPVARTVPVEHHYDPTDGYPDAKPVSPSTFAPKVAGTPCKDCPEGRYIQGKTKADGSPGNIYCDRKCWLNNDKSAVRQKPAPTFEEEVNSLEVIPF